MDGAVAQCHHFEQRAQRMSNRPTVASGLGSTANDAWTAGLAGKKWVQPAVLTAIAVWRSHQFYW